MAETHDHQTKKKLPSDLDGTDVLVGESGGLSAVYENAGAALSEWCIVTEHGSLFLDPDEELDVLDV